VPFRVGELAELDPGRHLGWAHLSSPAELLGLAERGLDVGNLDVERQVSPQPPR
jgi:hypothetical protein